jgi:hypothetical protein
MSTRISITAILLACSWHADAQPSVRAYVLCEAGFDHRNCLIVSRSGKLLSTVLLDAVGEARAEAYPRFHDGMLPFTEGSEPWLHGYVNDRGRIVAAPQYLEAEAFSEGRAKVCRKAPAQPAAKQPALEPAANTQAARSTVDTTSPSQTAIQKALINMNAAMAPPVARRTIEPPYCGYIDASGREVITLRAEWQHATRFQEGRALVRGAEWVDYVGASVGYRRSVKPWTVIDTRGRRVLGPDQHALLNVTRSFAKPRTEAEITGEFRSGVAPFWRPEIDRYGLMDVNGKVIADAVYRGRLETLNGAIALAERDLSGQEHLPDFQRETEAGLLNAKGYFRSFADLFKDSVLAGLEMHVHELYPHVDGATVFEINGDYIAIVDADLTLLLPPLRALLMDCGGESERCIASEKLLPISIPSAAEKVGMGPHHPIYIRLDGTTAIDIKLDDASSFSEGMACVSTDASAEVDVGFIDRKGRWLIPAQFQDCVDDFYGGRAIVRLVESHKIGNTWISDTALIDGKGKIIAKYSELLVQLRRRGK